MTRYLLATAFAVLAACVANAATISVVPGPGTPVQDAIDAAAPGDTLRLAGGGYPEAIVITKPLTLAGPPGTYVDAQPEPAVIAAGCGAATTAITIAADGVKIRDLRVITFTENGIDVQGRDRVRLQNVLTVPNCPADPPTYSVNVVASTRVKIDGCWITAAPPGVPGAAIHVGGIAARGNVRLTRTLAARHDIGILIENCGERSVSVARGFANFNSVTGIQLQDTDGIELKKNQVASNASFGIAVDVASEGNRIIANEIAGSATDVSDAGTGNCWKKNSYTTGSVPSCP